MTKAHLAALFAFSLWGFFPVYWKNFSDISSWSIFFQRILWSFLTTLIIIIFQKKTHHFIKIFKNPRTCFLLSLSSLLIAGNWLLYIHAVNTNQVIQASMGYFINPLFNIIFGAIFLNEKIRKGQWPSVILVIIAITLLSIQSDFSQFPWIALSLSMTFGIYGIIRKLTVVGALEGLCFEALMMILPAYIIISILNEADLSFQGLYQNLPWNKIFLLSLSGLVTSTPLILFAHGAKRLKLQTMAFIQYLSPTLKFLCGLLIFKEQLRYETLQSFILIWIALFFYSLESFYFVKSRNKKLKLLEV